MLNSYSNNIQVNANSIIYFNTDTIKYGCAITHTEGAGAIKLIKPGYYLVTFNGTASAQATSTAPIIVQLLNGSNVVVDGIAEELSTDASDITNLSFTTIIKVPKSCSVVDNTVTLTIQNSGVAASFINAAITITKII